MTPTDATQRTHLPLKIGLVAGWGDFPLRVAASLNRRGYQVHCLAIKDHADPNLARLCHEYRVFGIGRMGAQVRYLRRAGITEATMAGKIFKTRIFRKFHLLKHFPDWLTLRYFYPVFVTKTQNRRDDMLLGTVTELYAAQGIHFSPATDFAPELLVQPGNLTRQTPTSSQKKDIEFGWQMAKEMGRLDIGQTVVVKNQTVLSVEAIEGTDECIRRAGQLCQTGFIVVKVSKPNQDLRFDVPTIGVGTIRTIHESGGRVLAIEARKTIILDEAQTIAAAEQYGIVVVALE